MERKWPVEVSCDTCGERTGVDTGVCGRCAEDWNARDTVRGTARINKRRKLNGLAPLRREVVSDG